MKKILLTMSFLAVTFIGVQAQTFGMKAGVNFANIDTDEDISYDSKTGLNLGLFVAFDLSEKFTFQPELLYSTQGAKFEQFGAKIEAKINYIHIPLMFKLEAAENFYLEAGPQIGFLTTAKSKMTFDGETEEDDFKDETKATDFSLNMGLSYAIMDNLALGARYSLGLINIIDEQEEDEEVKNRVFALFVAYRF